MGHAYRSSAAHLPHTDLRWRDETETCSGALARISPALAQPCRGRSLSLWERVAEGRVRVDKNALCLTLTRRFAAPSPRGRGTWLWIVDNPVRNAGFDRRYKFYEAVERLVCFRQRDVCCGRTLVRLRACGAGAAKLAGLCRLPLPLGKRCPDVCS